MVVCFMNEKRYEVKNEKVFGEHILLTRKVQELWYAVIRCEIQGINNELDVCNKIMELNNTFRHEMKKLVTGNIKRAVFGSTIVEREEQILSFFSPP